ncbi:hypothetical protein CcrBL47_gp487 [Caulobacter phage BL47]|nr:hypothetical protein CcrBL47_gp487 [Caulobacter phage BL47]UTU10325.1 hypothetical protein CcrRB23_gp463 [Caulobacter phage RB23]
MAQAKGAPLDIEPLEASPPRPPAPQTLRRRRPILTDAERQMLGIGVGPTPKQPGGKRKFKTPRTRPFKGPRACVLLVREAKVLNKKPRMARLRGQKVPMLATRTPFSYDKAMDMREAGVSVLNIAKALDVSPLAIRAFVNTYASHVKATRGSNLSEEVQDQIVKAYAQGGVTQVQVAKQFGVSGPTVCNVIRRRAPGLGKSMRRYAFHPNRRLDIEVAAAAYEAGQTLREIAKAQGVSQNAVYLNLKTYAPQVMEAKRLERAAAKAAKEARKQAKLKAKEPTLGYTFNATLAIRTLRAGGSRQTVLDYFKISRSTLARMLSKEAPDLLRPRVGRPPKETP